MAFRGSPICGYPPGVYDKMIQISKNGMAHKHTKNNSKRRVVFVIEAESQYKCDEAENRV